MTDNFLNGFSTLRGNKSRNITFQSNTLPSNDCSSGFPIDKYKSYGGRGTNPWEVLYSIWNSYQNTSGAQFTLNQDISKAPSSNTNIIGLSNTNIIGPSNIFIIRHGEKNSSPPNYSINNNGIYRACQLMNYVNILAEEGTPISYIITCNSCPYNTSDPSMRPIQTISMVSFMLNIPIFIYGGAQDFSEVVNQLFLNDATINSQNTNPFNGLNVLICWEHSAIQALCLNILNGAGQSNRLSVSPTDDKNLYGDAFFKYTKPCPDGNYECTDSKPINPSSQTPSPYYIDPNSNSVPIYIGPHSQFYPYWNNYNFDSVYHLKSNSNNIFEEFKIFNQPCLTCYSSCDIHIGLYQPLTLPCTSSNKYPNEDSCELPPSSWKKI
jgi:hypothetical protein